MISFITKLFKHCKHDKNYRSKQYHSKDGTPMIEFTCNDCGYTDNGHVHTENWKDRLIVKKNNIIIDEPLRQQYVV